MSAPDIDEINKIRKAVGLPLLPSANATAAEDGPNFKEHASDDSDDDPASTLGTREAAGYENYRKLQEDERKRIEREKRKQQVQKARDAATKFKKIEGRGLGDIDDAGDVDTKAWLKGSKKRQAQIDRERADKLAEEQAERERLAAIEYTSADLAGVRVAHEIGDFEDAEAGQVLTLQDAEIGNDDASDEEDVLESSDLVAKEKLKDKLELKTRKAYDVHEDTAEKGLLSQYDDKKRKAFTLDSYGATAEDREAKRLQIGNQLKNMVNLDILKPVTTSDYMEIKMKKPKKGKKKSTRQRTQDDDDDEPVSTLNGSADVMDIDNTKSEVSSVRRLDANSGSVNDDDDLAKALSYSRRAALKKQKRKAEDIIQELNEANDEDNAVVQGGLIIDDTTNFLDTISSRPREVRLQAVVQPAVEKNEVESPASSDPDQQMGEAYNDVEDEQELLDRVRREQPAQKSEFSHSGLNEEEQLDQGMGAALNLLKQRGLVKAIDDQDRNGLYKDRQKFMAEARLREYQTEQKARTQRENDRSSGRMANMSAKEREEHARWQNTQREHHSSVQAAAAFNRDYRPDVNLKYVDDQGRLMNQKEAFKHLSHQFHGKGSGKQKTEKYLKKLEDEKRNMAASVLDSSKATGMSNAAGTQSKKNKEAGVRLG